jgi:hypothetical protein
MVAGIARRALSSMPERRLPLMRRPPNERQVSTVACVNIYFGAMKVMAITQCWLADKTKHPADRSGVRNSVPRGRVNSAG